jgi:hypothetical protein
MCPSGQGVQRSGDLEPPLDRRQQHGASIRGQPAAVETDMHRLTRAVAGKPSNIPVHFPYGGRKLCCFRFDPALATGLKDW